MFEWEESECPVTKLEIKKSEKSLYDLFDIGWAKYYPEYKRYEFDTDKFALPNNMGNWTFYSDLIGTVEAHDGGSAVTELRIEVIIPWEKPLVDFAEVARLRAAEAEKLAKEEEEKKKKEDKRK